VPRFVAELEAAVRVQDVMTKGVKTIAPTTTAEDAWNLMRLNRIHHLVVTKNRVVGVLSDRDAGGRRGAAVRENSTVAELMNTPAVTVEPTTTVRQACQRDARPLDRVPGRGGVWPRHRHRHRL
jgi:CBS domain-containing protein